MSDITKEAANNGNTVTETTEEVAAPLGEFDMHPNLSPHQTCDSCGSAISAKHAAINDSAADLYFCTHHARKFKASLEAQGFTLTPSI